MSEASDRLDRLIAELNSHADQWLKEKEEQRKQEAASWAKYFNQREEQREQEAASWAKYFNQTVKDIEATRQEIERRKREQ